MIYLIWAKDTCKFKIGYTATNAKNRLSALQTGSPTKLLLIGVIPGSYQDEQALHQKLEYLGSHGEWFDFAPVFTQKDEAWPQAIAQFLAGDVEEDNCFEFIGYLENLCISLMWQCDRHHHEKAMIEARLRTYFSELRIKLGRAFGALETLQYQTKVAIAAYNRELEFFK